MHAGVNSEGLGPRASHRMLRDTVRQAREATKAYAAELHKIPLEDVQPYTVYLHHYDNLKRAVAALADSFPDEDNRIIPEIVRAQSRPLWKQGGALILAASATGGITALVAQSHPAAIGTLGGFVLGRALSHQGDRVVRAPENAQYARRRELLADARCYWSRCREHFPDPVPDATHRQVLDRFPHVYDLVDRL